MSKNKRVKPVSFNITNEEDQTMLEHLKDSNFSGYVKSLILADIKRKQTLKHVKKTEGGGLKIIVG
ncbi:hypothetical protein KHA93_11540 [Bacillus sp. FJAT-49732]|uniref:Uncharacterized protein n=1 Tax=Lederbergia citrisecunda TaxID=2833583 RepID=A0A942TMZ4_9BACI|nr:hypothetical protein [Lederbergia citrisecunda]MBS4200263.1 hypothetical protein [Lederbergia citrisecunda]